MRMSACMQHLAAYPWGGVGCSTFPMKSSVSHQVAQSSSRPDQLNEEEIRDRRPRPRLLPGHTVVGKYVDNVHTFGGQAGAAGSRMNSL